MPLEAGTRLRLSVWMLRVRLQMHVGGQQEVHVWRGKAYLGPPSAHYRLPVNVPYSYRAVVV